MTPTTTRPAATAVLLAVTTAAVVLGGCSNAPAPPPSHPTVGAVQLPAPDARGPTVTVIGETNWAGSPPGCVLVQLDNGQTFQLTGPAVHQHLGQVRAGATAPVERMRLTGHVPPVGASVCGAVRSFVVEQAVPTGNQ